MRVNNFKGIVVIFGIMALISFGGCDSGNEKAVEDTKATKTVSSVTAPKTAGNDITINVSSKRKEIKKEVAKSTARVDDQLAQEESQQSDAARDQIGTKILIAGVEGTLVEKSVPVVTEPVSQKIESTPDAPPVAAGQPGSAPQMLIENPVYDAGTVWRGETVEHSFVVKNSGSAPLKILKARPG